MTRHALGLTWSTAILATLGALGACTNEGGDATAPRADEAALALPSRAGRCAADADCKDGYTCEKDGCGVDLGFCVEAPRVCPDHRAPECGCDGETYVNACARRAAGVDLRHAGRCEATSAVLAAIGDDRVPVCAGDDACKKTEVCVFDDGVCGGEGRCEPRPEVCPMYYRPVCGCDGETYGNACEAHGAGTSVASTGPCATACKDVSDCPDPDHQVCKQDGCGVEGVCVGRPVACTKEYAPVCGCDGETYDNACLAWQAGATVASEGECWCGGLMGRPCGDGELCDLDPGTCGIMDGTGECVPKPGACPDVWIPVCGCDGKTYGNDCDRLMSGVAKDHDGPCELVACKDSQDCQDNEWCATSGCGVEGTCQLRPTACPDVWMPVCGCDGETYGNKCEAASNGVSVAHEGECQATCGGIAGIPCKDGELCDPRPGECAIMDGQGSCVPKPEVCPDVWMPVCGCDGKTYGNDCDRLMSGVGKDHDGACGCAPVTCDLYCRYGYAHDETGCEICKCNPAPEACCDPNAQPDCMSSACCADGLWHCGSGTSAGGAIPVPASICGDLGEGKMCAACCDPKAEPGCQNGATCCGDGQWACNDLTGHASCDSTGAVCGCAPVTCDLYCPWGYQAGADGCDICACNPPPCEPVTCDLFCPYGYAVDETGCETCKCNPAPECPPLCDMYCRYGNKVDANGCELCECNPGPTCCDAAGKPECPGGEVTCCDDGRWQCDAAMSPMACNAKGEVCATTCDALMTCRLYCPYGYEIGADGCEVCQCKAPPVSACCDANAEPPCQNGATCCADGQWACTRLDGSSGCTEKGEICPAP